MKMTVMTWTFTYFCLCKCSGFEWVLWTHIPSALPLSLNVCDIFSTGSREHRFPTVGHTQHYIQGQTALQFIGGGGLSHTHSSHALAGSHTVDSHSSAGVINDFLWIPSNSPSIVNPLFLIEATPLCAISFPPFGKDGWRDSDTSSEEQEVLAGGRTVIFLIHRGSTKFRRCVFNMLLSCLCVCHV